MADQNKDGTKPISSGLQPGPSEHLIAGMPQMATASSTTTGTTQTTSRTSSTGSATANMDGKTTKVADTVKESGARFAEEAKQYAGDMANLAKEKSRTLFSQQKETAVGQVDSISQALRNTAQNMQGGGQDQIGQYIEMAADK